MTPTTPPRPSTRPARALRTAAARPRGAVTAAATGGEDDERAFSDEVGFFWEDAGGTRMAGRVLGALLLADPPETSSSALGELLGVSSGSVSTATRELIRPGLVKRVRVPGQRQDYFKATMDARALPQLLLARLELARRWQHLMSRGKEIAAHKDPIVQTQLEAIREFYEFLESEQEALLARWERRQHSRSR